MAVSIFQVIENLLGYLRESQSYARLPGMRPQPRTLPTIYLSVANDVPPIRLSGQNDPHLTHLISF